MLAVDGVDVHQWLGQYLSTPIRLLSWLHSLRVLGHARGQIFSLRILYARRGLIWVQSTDNRSAACFDPQSSSGSDLMLDYVNGYLWVHSPGD